MSDPVAPAPRTYAPYVPQIRRYQDWLRAQRGLSFDSYDALWRWSVGDLRAFWQSIWDYFDLRSPTPFQSVLAEERMPGARWFEGAVQLRAAGVPPCRSRARGGLHGRHQPQREGQPSRAELA